MDILMVENDLIMMVDGNIVMNAVDAFTGEPITRTKTSNPYNYQAFDMYNDGVEGSSSMYSDRMYSWDYKKFDRCYKEVWGRLGQSFDYRSKNDIEKFLKLYIDNDTLVLNRIIEGCNPSNGYSYWFFSFTCNKKGV